MEGRKQFTFYRSYAEAIRQLDPEDQHAVLMAMIDYALDGIVPTYLTAIQNALFCLIKPVLDTGRKKAAGGSKPKRSKKDTAKEKEKEVEKELEVELEDECLAKTDGFESFWQCYPVKVGKSKAQEIWKAGAFELPAVMEGLQRWKDSQQWSREDGRFIPRAWRWLAEKQYLEHPQPVSKPIWGATGILGEAELEAIKRVMQEEQ